MNIFKDIIPEILQGKNEVITVENEKDYVPFVVNKALSFHYDCIIQANEMNKLPNLPNVLQFQYLLHSIRGYKRPFQRWQRIVDDENLSLIKEYFGYSNEKAKDALRLLTEDQIETIRTIMDKGGIKR